MEIKVEQGKKEKIGEKERRKGIGREAEENQSKKGRREGRQEE